MKRKILLLLLSLSLIVIVFATIPYIANAASVETTKGTWVYTQTSPPNAWYLAYGPNITLGRGSYICNFVGSNITGQFDVAHDGGAIFSNYNPANFTSTGTVAVAAFTLDGTYNGVEVRITHGSSVGSVSRKTFYKTDTQTVNFNQQSGSGGASTIYEYYGNGWYSNAICTSSVSYVSVPTKSGYSFGGYYTSTNGSGTQIVNSSGAVIGSSSTYSVGTSPSTAYAYWIPNSYTISYSANGGSGAPGTQTKYYGTNLTLSSTVPARTGYAFLGWSTSSTATAATYSAGSTYTSNAGATLYAVWKINTSTLNINPNGGTWNGYTASISFTQNYSTTKSIPVPTKTGYNFTGWTRTNSYGSLSSATAAATYTYGATNGVTDTITANWSAYTYTVSYNANGGSGAPSNQTKYYGTNLTLSSTVPTRTGYTFLGWNTSSTATSATYSAGSIYTSNAGATLYAVWKIENKTITVSANPTEGGTVTGGGTVTYGTILNLTATANTGYKFVSWSDGNTSNPRAITATVAASYIAQFEKDTYTVSLVTGNGTITGENITEYTYGVGATLPTASDLSYGALSFAGWYENVEFSGPPVTAISTTEIGNKIYYAKWTASGVTNASFDSFVDSGYYSVTPDAADEEKEGIIAFSTGFASIEQYGNQVTDFGIWIYKAGATENDKVQLCKTDDISLAELKTNGGEFYATVENIGLEFINNEAFALPYIVIGGQAYFGSPISGTVDLSKWLGEKTAE